MAARQWIVAQEKSILRLLVVFLSLVLTYFVWAHFHPLQTVTLESQEQAQTVAGVQQAANAARVPISAEQDAMIASAIKQDADKTPDSVVQTTGAKLEETIQTELQKSGGQFSIVTDPKNTDKVPTLTQVSGKTVTTAVKAEAISPNTPVTLNQYNIKAYPDRLIQVGGSYQEVLAAYSWKVNVPKMPLIAPHGDVGYFGIYGHANLDHHDMSRIGIMLTIPK